MFNPEKKRICFINKDTHSLLNENNPTKSTLDILMINNTTHMFSLSWWGYYFKQRDMLSPSKMITYHFQGWIQKFSGVGRGCRYTFQFYPPHPKNIHQNISDEEWAFKECCSIFFDYSLFFSYVYFWIFIYFLREEENDYLQIRGFVKTCELIANVSKASSQFSTCLSY